MQAAECQDETPIEGGHASLHALRVRRPGRADKGTGDRSTLLVNDGPLEPPDLTSRGLLPASTACRGGRSGPSARCGGAKLDGGGGQPRGGESRRLARPWHARSPASRGPFPGSSSPATRSVSVHRVPEQTETRSGTGEGPAPQHDVQQDAGVAAGIVAPEDVIVAHLLAGTRELAVEIVDRRVGPVQRPDQALRESDPGVVAEGMGALVDQDVTELTAL